MATDRERHEARFHLPICSPEFRGGRAWHREKAALVLRRMWDSGLLGSRKYLHAIFRRLIGVSGGWVWLAAALQLVEYGAY
jgi:hypothetical protein